MDKVKKGVNVMSEQDKDKLVGELIRQTMTSKPFLELDIPDLKPIKNYVIVVYSTHNDKAGVKFMGIDQASGGYPWWPDTYKAAHLFNKEEDAVKSMMHMVEQKPGCWGKEGAYDYGLPHDLRGACVEQSCNSHGHYGFVVSVVEITTDFSVETLFSLNERLVKAVGIEFVTYKRINTQPDKIVKWLVE